MEIASTNNNLDELTVNSKIPSAPEFDEESLGNNIEEWPERVERSRYNPSSFLAKLKNTFRNYKRMRANEIDNRILENSINNYGSNQLIIPNNFYNHNLGHDNLLNNQDNRNLFLRKLYAWLLGQQLILTTLAALFYYVPHIRKIFRKTFSDKIFLRNYVGVPLGIFVIGLLIFKPLRRKFPLASYLSITACLSTILCYIMAYQSDNLFLLFELSLSSGSFASAELLNFIIPQFNLKNRYETLYFPSAMTSLQFLQPLVTKRHFSSSWYLNLISILGVSYLGSGIGSVINDEKLNLKSNEHIYAASEVIINPIYKIPHLIRKRFSRRVMTNYERI